MMRTFVFVQKVTGHPTQDGLQKKAWMFLRGAVTASLCRRCGQPQPLHIIPSCSRLPFLSNTRHFSIFITTEADEKMRFEAGEEAEDKATLKQVPKLKQSNWFL